MHGSQNIVIIDTGCANISSVRFAIERLGYKVQISHDLIVSSQQTKFFCPVSAPLKEAMRNLEERDLIRLIKDIEQPLLGICLGMQLLGMTSDEGKESVNCLGHVNASNHLLETNNLPLPHMGWNRVHVRGDHPLFQHIPDQSHFYFVHSYGMPVGAHTIGEAFYGQNFSAAIQHNNYFGVQFHPERSSKAGAQLIQNFLEMQG